MALRFLLMLLVSGLLLQGQCLFCINGIIVLFIRCDSTTMNDIRSYADSGPQDQPFPPCSSLHVQLPSILSNRVLDMKKMKLFIIVTIQCNKQLYEYTQLCDGYLSQHGSDYPKATI